MKCYCLRYDSCNCFHVSITITSLSLLKKQGGVCVFCYGACQECSCPSDILGSHGFIGVFGSSHGLTKSHCFLQLSTPYAVPSIGLSLCARN